jgi:hypothetical protein
LEESKERTYRILSESCCGGRCISQPILREIFDAVETDPIDGAHELRGGSEELFVADGEAPTEEVGDDLVKRKGWARILF